jgi:hypothetical protein
MAVLRLTRWVFLYLLAHIQFVDSQNITVLVHFGSGDVPASVVAADEIAATYVASYTNECRSGPCSPLTIYTDIMVQGPSTAVRTNVGDPSANQTFQCNVISSTTGTCTYIGTYRGAVSEYTTTFGSPYDLWSTLVVTAGLDKLSGITDIMMINGAAAATSTSATTTSAAPTSTPSTSATPTSTSTSSASSSLSSTLPSGSSSATSSLSSSSYGNSTVTSTSTSSSVSGGGSVTVTGTTTVTPGGGGTTTTSTRGRRVSCRVVGERGRFCRVCGVDCLLLLLVRFELVLYAVAGLVEVEKALL